MQLNGYVKLYRKFVQWGWYKDSVCKDLFLHLLCTASYTDFEWQGEKYPAGCLITSYKNLSADLGFSTQQIRTAIKKLCSTNEISQKTTNKFQCLKVLNWAVYQSAEIQEQQTNNNQITNKQQTSNKQITTSEEYKNKRNKEVYFNARPRAREKNDYAGYDIDKFEEVLNKED